MLDAEALGKEIREGKSITRQEAMELYSQPLEKLCRTADAIRRRFCSDRFDLCSILNAKSGRCPENCRFCAQSSHNRTQTPEYPLLSTEEIVNTVGTRELLEHMDVDDIMSYMNDMGIKTEWEGEE